MKNLSGHDFAGFHAERPGRAGEGADGLCQDGSGFTFKSGFVEGRVIDIKSIQELATMPSREEILAKVFPVNASAQRLVTAIGGVGRNLAVVLDQGVKENKFAE